MPFNIIIGKLQPINLSEVLEEQHESGNLFSVNFDLSVSECEGEEPPHIAKCHRMNEGAQWSPSHGAYDRFVKNSPAMSNLADRGGFSPLNSYGHIFLLNLPDILQAMDELEKECAGRDDMPLGAWMVFWVREAVKRYGNEAAIIFK